MALSSRIRSSLSLVLMLAAILALSACWVEPEQPYLPPSQPATPQPTSTQLQPARVAIATGETLEAEPGKGAGVFVEYHGNGKWRVWATCDTLITGAPCNYELFLRPEPNARLNGLTMGIEGSENNIFDEIDAQLIRVSMRTTTETDSVEFRTEPPGAATQLQTLLDGSLDSRIIFWVGPEVLHTGAPTNPVIFEPTSP
ncbi:MAG: hypothetical protein RMJ98_21365 [Myxococcales bacterium]|nr:hypothetical protein [Polyangiaceae bacterium]MDW8251854.1 hypothetical protein [Myxococcales bacterium]